jgi:hypothetical protein
MMRKDKRYFSHDLDAHTDEKIGVLRQRHGWEGYGIFWAIVERMHAGESKQKVSAIKSLSFLLAVDYEDFTNIVNTCIEVGLFETDGQHYWSQRVYKNEKHIAELLKKRRDAGKKGAEIKWNRPSTNPMPVNDTQKAAKKVTEKRSFVPPTKDEVVAYFIEKGYRGDVGAKAFEYYDLAQWKDSNDKPVRNWKQKMLSVWFKEENKITVNNNNDEHKRKRKEAEERERRLAAERD